MISKQMYSLINVLVETDVSNTRVFTRREWPLRKTYINCLQLTNTIHNSVCGIEVRNFHIN